MEGLGYNLNDSQSQIIGLESGTEQQTISLRDALEERGIFGSVFCAPATPKNRSMVRLSLNSALNQQELDRILDACAEIRSGTAFTQWSSTRRRRNEPRTGTAVAEATRARVRLAGAPSGG
jgi:CAI-1 autoinducer synthase